MHFTEGYVRSNSADTDPIPYNFILFSWMYWWFPGLCYFATEASRFWEALLCRRVHEMCTLRQWHEHQASFSTLLAHCAITHVGCFTQSLIWLKMPSIISLLHSFASKCVQTLHFITPLIRNCFNLSSLAFICFKMPKTFHSITHLLQNAFSLPTSAFICFKMPTDAALHQKYHKKILHSLH